MSRMCLARVSRYVPLFRAATHDLVRLTGAIIYDLAGCVGWFRVLVGRLPRETAPR